MSRLTPRTAAALAICTGFLAAGCSATPAPESDSVDLGSDPAKAGTVKKDALNGMTLTFVSYGGIYQKGQENSSVRPFETESGAKVLSDGPTDYAKIQAQVESKNVAWDVVDTGSTFAVANCEQALHGTRHVDHRHLAHAARTRLQVCGARHDVRLRHDLQHR